MEYTASYLTGQVAGRAFGGGDFVPESSRRARGFAAWAALRALGRSGVADLIERSLRARPACRTAPRARRRRRGRQRRRAQPGARAASATRSSRTSVERLVQSDGDLLARRRRRGAASASCASRCRTGRRPSGTSSSRSTQLLERVPRRLPPRPPDWTEDARFAPMRVRMPTPRAGTPGAAARRRDHVPGSLVGDHHVVAGLESDVPEHSRGDVVLPVAERVQARAAARQNRSPRTLPP